MDESSAKEEEPKRARKEEHKAGIDDNGPKKLVRQRKTNKEPVHCDSKEDAGEQAQKPGWEEGAENIKRRCMSTACK